MTSDAQIPAYTIRQCTALSDFAACVEMQRTVWQFADVDITPLRSFVITLHNGGCTYGAFAEDDGRMLGFAHALAGHAEDLRPYYYSQMLAVEPSLQNAGIGVKLKLAQREHSFKRGVGLIRWTFDPMQSRNAHLNINKLGCIIRNYLVNYYGQTSSSVLHRGLDSDRLFADWYIGSARVAAALAGERCTDAPVAAVEVPYDTDELKKRDLAAAQEWQSRVRNEFQNCLAEGLYCAGFEPGRNGGNSRYLFFKDDHSEEK